MKNKLIILSICLLSFMASAQVPGYMGKHVIVSYSVNIFPCVLGPSANRTNGSSYIVDYIAGAKLLGLNATHSFDISYIHKNRKAICIGGQYLKTGVDYRYVNGYSFLGDRSKPAQLSSFSMSIGLKLFRRANFAPLGAYVKWEGLVYFSNLKFDKDHYYRGNGDPNSLKKVSVGDGIVELSNLAIAFSFGKQRVIADKFVLDYGMRFSFFPEAFGQLTSQESNNVNGQFEIDSLFRLQRHELINAHIGIGFLAF